MSSLVSRNARMMIFFSIINSKTFVDYIQITDGSPLSLFDIVCKDIYSQMREKRLDYVIKFDIIDYVGVYMKQFQVYLKKMKESGKITQDESDLILKLQTKKVEEQKPEFDILSMKMIYFSQIVLKPVTLMSNLIYRLFAEFEINPSMPKEQLIKLQNKFKGLLVLILELTIFHVTPYSSQENIEKLFFYLGQDLLFYKSNPEVLKNLGISLDEIKERMLGFILPILEYDLKRRGPVIAFPMVGKFFSFILPNDNLEDLQLVFQALYDEIYKNKLSEMFAADNTLFENMNTKVIFQIITMLENSTPLKMNENDKVVIVNNFISIADTDPYFYSILPFLLDLLGNSKSFSFIDDILLTKTLIQIFSDFANQLNKEDEKPIALLFDEYMTVVLGQSKADDNREQLVTLKLLNFFQNPEVVKSCSFERMPDGLIQRLESLWNQNSYVLLVNVLRDYFYGSNDQMVFMMKVMKRDNEITLMMTDDEFSAYVKDTKARNKELTTSTIKHLSRVKVITSG